MKKVSLELGSGGQLMRTFIDSYILKSFDNTYLRNLPDAAHLPYKVAFTTDSYVVDPIFFPGGDIGTLCVNGTVNDLVVSGAEPQFLSLALILEEGLSYEDLGKILKSIKKSALLAGVKIITGDTKVVRQGQGDKIFINTAGIGSIVIRPAPDQIRSGDKILVTGQLGEHSLAVMLARGEFGLESTVKSDCAPLNFLLPVWKKGALWMRDITRGGLASVLCELAETIPFSVILEEEDIPLSRAVLGATELLGIDPLFLACEGRAVLVVPAGKADEILAEIRKDRLGKKAAIIGHVDTKVGQPHELLLKTVSGGLRRLEPLSSELLPRIC
jgi:hydrogenase expression/formation protein HypE